MGRPKINSVGGGEKKSKKTKIARQNRPYRRDKGVVTTKCITKTKILGKRTPGTYLSKKEEQERYWTRSFITIFLKD